MSIIGIILWTTRKFGYYNIKTHTKKNKKNTLCPILYRSKTLNFLKD